jgi:hypothetical protein
MPDAAHLIAGYAYQTGATAKSKDILFLIQPGFARPNRDSALRFVCPDCNTIEGLLASAPEQEAQAAQHLQVIRVPFERPRSAVVDLIGLENQNLPVLILGDATDLPPDAQWHNGHYFISDCSRIAELLAQRHGFFCL